MVRRGRCQVPRGALFVSLLIEPGTLDPGATLLPMKSTNPIVRATLTRAALLTTVLATSHAAEQIVDAGPVTLEVIKGGSVWFDSGNTNVPIPVTSINGATPATGFLPGWAHTRWSFMEYDGANVVEIPNAEKVLGTANITTATATSDYYDNGSLSTLSADRSIGLVETTRDFVIENGATLDIAKGGLLFHNADHWMKTGTGGGFVTSSSGQLTVVGNGGQTNCQINGVIVKDFDGSTPLTFVKTGPDSLYLTAANTYTGGTWINNGRLRATNTLGYGAAASIVHVTGANSQACLGIAGTYANAFQIEGLGWTEGTEKRGAIRFETAGNVTGAVTLTGAARIAVNTGITGSIGGALSGSTALELGFTGGAAYTGTLNLNGSGTAMTGPVTVSTGHLNVNNGLGGSVTVAGGASLGGESAVAGSLTTGGATASGLVVNGATPAVLAVAGAVDVSAGTTTVTVTGTPVPAAPFTAFTYGSLTGPVANLIPAGVRGGTLSDDSANSRVLISFTPASLTWTGGANANWTQNGDLNFDSSGPTNFFNGDSVSFTQAAAVKTVTLVGQLYPSSVTFDHTSDYTVLAPLAGIGGVTGLTKNGSGTLSLQGQTSSFTGPVTVNAGRIKYSTHWEALGYNSGVTIASGAQLDLNGSLLTNVGRAYDWTIAGAGPDGLGAITNSAAAGVNDSSGIRNVTLTADASIGGNGGRLDIGNNTGTGVLTGNGHTLTKVGSTGMGVRTNGGGSPVHFVIAAGAAWGENTDNAWGGTTGTLRIKSGARAGTYGTRSIATPVTLEGGGTLYNEGGGKGTWTGAVVFEGNATVESGNGLLDLMGPVTGAFSLTKTGAMLTYLADVQYTGDTTVSAGVLSVGTATLANGSTVSISATVGTKLDLPHGEEDQISVLLIGGVPQPVGFYGATGSGATVPDDIHFSGTGTLKVTSAGTPYQIWAALKGIPGASPEEDSDNDGIANGIEFVIGGEPSGPGSDSSALLPVIDNSDATYVDFVFRRSFDFEGSDPYVEYGSDLTGWTVAEPGEPALNPVVINEVNMTGYDEVTVRIPRALAAGGKFFARLRVDLP